MGCATGSDQRHQTVPIQNNMLTLLMTGQNQLLIKRMKLEGRNIDFNMRLNFKGDTFLHYAAVKDNKEIIKFLLQNFKDINVNQQNDDQLKPIDVAKSQQIKQMLKKKGIVSQKVNKKEVQKQVANKRVQNSNNTVI